MVERQALVVGRDDGGVSRADEAEVTDLRADEVTLLAASQDLRERYGSDGSLRLRRLEERVEVDRPVLVADSDEGVVLRDCQRRDCTRLFGCERDRQRVLVPGWKSDSPIPSVPHTHRKFCPKSNTSTQPLVVPIAIRPLTAMTVGWPIALLAICSACESAAAPAVALLCGYTRAEMRLRDDHLTVRAGGAMPFARPAEEAFEADVPVGRSEVDGRSKRLV